MVSKPAAGHIFIEEREAGFGCQIIAYNIIEAHYFSISQLNKSPSNSVSNDIFQADFYALTQR